MRAQVERQCEVQPLHIEADERHERSVRLMRKRDTFDRAPDHADAIRPSFCRRGLADGGRLALHGAPEPEHGHHAAASGFPLGPSYVC